MSRTLLIADCHNLFTEGQRKFGKLLNYGKLLEAYSDTGFNLMQKVAYGKQPEEIVVPFATLMRKLGFELHFRNANHNVPMSLRVAEAIADRSIDRLVMGTTVQDAGYILEYAKRKGVLTYVFGFNVPKSFYNLAEVFEIDEDNMQERKVNAVKTTEQVVMPTSVPSEPVSPTT